MNNIILDLSEHNGYVDMQQVKNSGVYGIIQRVGYGLGNIDPTAKRNIDNALNVGLKVGCYWFMYSLNTQQALQESKYFNSFLSNYSGKLELPVFCDFEYDTERYANQNGVYFDNNSRTQIVLTFLDYLERQGWYVGNYANVDYLNKFNDLNRFDLWLAYWGSNPPQNLINKSGVWQYMSTGKINGINGNVDFNYPMRDYPSIIKQNKLNGFGFVNNSVNTVDNSSYLSTFAREVIKGNYGNGNARITNIYNTIQNEVNNILYNKGTQNNYITEFARDVINGKYGNGSERKSKIYNAVQNEVNKLI